MTLQRTFAKEIFKSLDHQDFHTLNQLSQDDGIFVPNPLCEMPLSANLTLTRGVGSATFTRSTIATYIDKVDGLVKTAGVNEPRFETNGVLIEGFGQNDCLHSVTFNNGIWAKSNVSIIQDVVAAPDGTLTAERYSAGAVTHSLTQPISVVSGQIRTFSVWVKSATGVDQTILMQGNTTAHQPITVTSEWQRFEFVYSVSTTGARSVGFADDSELAVDMYIWGAQDEELDFASSFMSTSSAITLRSADTLTIDEANIPIPTDDYSVSVVVTLISRRLQPDVAQTIYSVNGETDRHLKAKKVGTVPEFSHSNTINGTSMPGGQQTKFVALKSSSVIQLLQDNISTGISTPATVTGTKDFIRLGDHFGDEYLYGHLKAFKIFAQTLTLAQAKTL